MKKSYEIPEIEFIEVGEKDCIVMSGLQNHSGSDALMDFGKLWNK